MFPVRCYTCNSVIANKHAHYSGAIKRGEDSASTLRTLKVDRMCCRRMFIGHVDIISVQMDYPNDDSVLDSGGTTLLRKCRHECETSCD